MRPWELWGAWGTSRRPTGSGARQGSPQATLPSGPWEGMGSRKACTAGTRRWGGGGWGGAAVQASLGSADQVALQEAAAQASVKNQVGLLPQQLSFSHGTCAQRWRSRLQEGSNVL